LNNLFFVSPNKDKERLNKSARDHPIRSIVFGTFSIFPLFLTGLFGIPGILSARKAIRLGNQLGLQKKIKILAFIGLLLGIVGISFNSFYLYSIVTSPRFRSPE
jgi:hypothetical protein